MIRDSRGTDIHDGKVDLYQRKRRKIFFYHFREMYNLCRIEKFYERTFMRQIESAETELKDERDI